MPKADKQQNDKRLIGGLRWKKKQTVCTFAINAAGIDSSVEKLHDLLLNSGYEKKNAHLLVFSLDALLFEWYEHGLENAPAELYIEKVLGQKKVVVEVCGKIDDAGKDDSSESYPWTNGLKANGLIWSSAQTSDGMRAELAIPKKRMGIGVSFLIAIAAAAATVFALSILPGDAFSSANEMIFGPLFEIGVGLLTALIGPMVFLSIVSGILSVGDIATLKRLGSRVLTRVMQSNVLALAVATIGAIVILRSNISLGAGATNIGEDLLHPLFAIIPTSFFQPFIDGNVLQITVWAIIFGIGALLLKPRIPVICNVVFELNGLIQWVVVGVARIMPVFIYLALLRIFSNISKETVVTLLQLFIVLIAVTTFVAVVSILLAARRRNEGFATIIKKMLPVLMTSFLTSSTAASFPLICETMKKLSVDEPVINFHTPIAVSTAHSGLIISIMLSTAAAASLGDYTISITQLIILVVLCFILGVAAPSAPGGAIAIYALLFASLGLDTTFLPLCIAIDPITDMCNTPLSVTCIMTTGLQVDSDLKENSEDFT